jgi:hypothetical protein
MGMKSARHGKVQKQEIKYNWNEIYVPISPNMEYININKNLCVQLG